MGETSVQNNRKKIIFFLAGFGVSDLTQPGLLSLQPTLEDFPMDTFDIQGKIGIVMSAK